MDESITLNNYSYPLSTRETVGFSAVDSKRTQRSLEKSLYDLYLNYYRTRQTGSSWQVNRAMGKANALADQLVSAGVIEQTRAFEISHKAEFDIDYAGAPPQIAEAFIKLKVFHSTMLQTQHLPYTGESKASYNCRDLFQKEISAAAQSDSLLEEIYHLRNIIFMEKQFRDTHLTFPVADRAALAAYKARFTAASIDLVDITAPKKFTIDALPAPYIELLKATAFGRTNYYQWLKSQDITIYAAPAMEQLLGSLDNDSVEANIVIGMESAVMNTVFIEVEPAMTLIGLLATVVHETIHLEQDNGGRDNYNNFFYAEKDAYAQQLSFLQAVRGTLTKQPEAATELLEEVDFLLSRTAQIYHNNFIR